MRQSRFKRICVFCGSSQGKKRSYHDAAIELGNELVINQTNHALLVEFAVIYTTTNRAFRFTCVHGHVVN